MDTPNLDLAAFDAIDEAAMEVLTADGRTTGWTWFFAGPGHPKGIEQSNRVAREELAKARLKEQAQVNGRKWKAPERVPDELREENVNFVMERLLRWSPIRIDGEDFPFTSENVRKLLIDPRKGGLLQQAIDFILADNSFTKRSPKT